MNMKKYLKFIRKPCEDEEYLVKNIKGEALGDISNYDFKKNKIGTRWNFYPVSVSLEGDLWFGASCLREIAEFIDSLGLQRKE